MKKKGTKQGWRLLCKALLVRGQKGSKRRKYYIDYDRKGNETVDATYLVVEYPAPAQLERDGYYLFKQRDRHHQRHLINYP